VFVDVELIEIEDNAANLPTSHWRLAAMRVDGMAA
jgi:hypothetical protein